MQDLSSLARDNPVPPAVEAWSLNHTTPLGKSSIKSCRKQKIKESLDESERGE